jgi:hypothetical protein
MNSHASIVTRVGAAVLKDIEGLNGESVGFERSECCGPLPPKLPGSFESLIHHAFMSTTVNATLWDKMCSNVEGFEGLRGACKSKLPKSMATAFYDASAAARSVILFKYDEEANRVHATEYSGEWQPSELPWEAKGVIASDRSNETFIFVCAHLRRDDRCGYCGPVLVELMKQAIAKHPSTKVQAVRVFPCSHVGGHVYAGNVLLYNSQGSICVGCFCPSDIEALLDGIATNDVATVPPSLEARVRGRMGGVQSEKKETRAAL